MLFYSILSMASMKHIHAHKPGGDGKPTIYVHVQ